MRKLQDTETLYTDIAPRALIAHLEEGCTDRHALELLAFHNEMQRYYLEVQGIPKYINIIKNAQKQAGRTGQTIAEKTLLLFASTAMLTTEQ